VLANSRVAAAQRCLHRLKHLVDLPCHAKKTELTDPLGSDFISFLFVCFALLIHIKKICISCSSLKAIFC